VAELLDQLLAERTCTPPSRWNTEALLSSQRRYLEALCPRLAGYFPGKVEKAGKVVRAIAVLAHPIPNTDNAASAQIILPQRQTGRKNDIYVFCSSSSHHVCAPNKWLAFVSTIVETTDPERELQAGALTSSLSLGSSSLCHMLGFANVWQEVHRSVPDSWCGRHIV